MDVDVLSAGQHLSVHVQQAFCWLLTYEHCSMVQSIAGAVTPPTSIPITSLIHHLLHPQLL